MRTLGPVLLLLGCSASLDLASVEQAATVCADGATVEGIDVSKWQGTIDWDGVATTSVAFAFIRVNHGLTDLDEKFAYNWAEARRAGVRRGAYQYFLPGEDAVEQAQLLLDRMGPLEPDDLPPVLDVENADGQSAATIVAKMHAWLAVVEAATGRRPILYTAKYFWQDGVGRPDDFLDHPLWVAHYDVTCPLIADPWERWDFWQYSDSGRVTGIGGDVDRDVFNGDGAALAAFVAGSVLCGDGTCDPSESAGSCAADCACAPLPAAGGVVDDVGGCFVAAGSPDAWRLEAAGHGGSLRWTFAWDEPEDNSGSWTLALAEAGRYQVEVHTPAPWAMSRAARYEVRHAGTVDAVVLDQSAADGWQLLGEWEFAAGGDQSVRLGDSTGELLSDQRKLVFDAVRLARVDGSEEPPDAGALPGPTPDAAPGGEVTPGAPSLCGCRAVAGARVGAGAGAGAGAGPGAAARGTGRPGGVAALLAFAAATGALRRRAGARAPRCGRRAPAVRGSRRT